MLASRRFAALRAALILGVSVTVASCSRVAAGTLPPGEAATPVRVAPVSVGGDVTITATGALGAKDEIPLAFKIGGVVARVLVDEGARVKAGEQLAELDLREIDAMMAKATAGTEKARRDAARVGRLYRDSVATLAQYEDAQTALTAAEADLRAARVNREFAVITATTDGIVLKRDVNPGAQVAPGTEVVRIGSAARGSVVRVGLADRDALRVRVGDVACATFDADPGREYNGRVTQIGASADARTGTFTVEVTVSGAAALPSGLVANVQITARAAGTARSGQGVASFPAEALVDGDGTVGTVFVLDASGERAIRRTVTLLGIDGDRVLARGLAGATRVITAGAAWLKDSARVEIKP
jgi:multidrug efflux system membrane fusion protein